MYLCLYGYCCSHDMSVCYDKEHFMFLFKLAYPEAIEHHDMEKITRKAQLLSLALYGMPQ